ncbi:UNVERIFIED_CONTAM: hypothetical protein NCL1_41894 [Trichonephila clavipes]
MSMTSCNHMCCQRLLGPIFEHGNPQTHTEKVLQDCLWIVTTLTWPTRYPDLSPIEQIGDHLGWLVGHPTILNEQDSTLQQIGYEMSQCIIQNICMHYNAGSYCIVHSR